PASPIEFTGDGRFFSMEQDASGSAALARSTAPASTGTFTVLDASAALGAGTYQVRFTAANGGVFLSQVDVFGAPARLRFFSPAAADFVPAQTLAYQAGVCGPSF